MGSFGLFLELVLQIHQDRCLPHLPRTMDDDDVVCIKILADLVEYPAFEKRLVHASPQKNEG
jgi:hypothetical protein